jgi:hypothetical protein
MEPGGSMRHPQELSNNRYTEPNNQILRTDTYFFNIHSNFVLSSMTRPS